MRAWRLTVVLLLWGPLGSTARAQDAPLAEALKTLKSGSFDARMKALASLEALGQAPAGAAGGKRPDVEGAVLGALDDKEWEVQIRVAQALAKVGGEKAVEALVQTAMRGEVHAVRVAAAEALAALDAAAASESLLKLARGSRSDAHKVNALRAVGRLKRAEALAGLGPFLRVREMKVAGAAARAVADLSASGPTAQMVLEHLEPALKRRSERTEFEGYAPAVDALGRLDHPAARKRLIDEVLRLEDGDPYVPMRAGRALAAQPPDAVAAALREAQAAARTPLAQRRWAGLVGAARASALASELAVLITSSQPGVRVAAAHALGQLGDAASAAPLLARLDDKDEAVRVQVVTALARCSPRGEFHGLAARLCKDRSALVRTQFVAEIHDHGDPAGLAALLPFLADEDWLPASAAAAALGTLGVADDMQHLAALVKHSRWQVRGAAFEGLGRLRAIAAVPLLADGLKDKDPVVKSVCLANLQILTGQRLEARPGPWHEWYERHGRSTVLIKRSRRSAEEKAKEAEERAKSRYAHEHYEWRKRALEVLQRARILVTIGAWDHVQRVLDHLDIPHTLLRAQELKESGLNPNQVLLVNCEGTQDGDGQERIRWFVNVGGYLMSTDWALVNTIQTCFPGYLVPQHQFSTGNDVVVIEEAQPGHPWTKGVFEHVPALKWWLEIQAFPVLIASPERVEVLVDSAEMRAKYGSSTMAAAFRFGLGKVQHSVSHFFLQEEGLVAESDPHARRVFAADHLGVPLAAIRTLAASGRFSGPLTDEVMRELAPHYSMFRLIVNVVRDKEDWVQDL